MDPIDQLKNHSTEQLATIQSMSWKTLCMSFNLAAFALQGEFKRLDEARNAAEEDIDLISQLTVVVNALGYYQAALAKVMIAKHPDKVAHVKRVGPGKPPQVTFMTRDAKWVPGNLQGISNMDQQQAEVSNFLASLSSEEHGSLISCAAKLHDRLTRAYESIGPIGKAADCVILPLDHPEELDKLAVMIKMSAVMFNKAFEERWPEYMPS